MLVRGHSFALARRSLTDLTGRSRSTSRSQIDGRNPLGEAGVRRSAFTRRFTSREVWRGTTGKLIDQLPGYLWGRGDPFPLLRHECRLLPVPSGLFRGCPDLAWLATRTAAP